MGYFWVSLSLRGGIERVSLEGCLLRALGCTLNRILLNCGDERALPWIITQKKKGEQILEVAVINMPRSVLPCNAIQLRTGALCDRNLLLLCRWENHLGSRGERRYITIIIDVSVTVSRHMSATAAAEVRVHVDVRVRVRHLNWCKGVVIVWRLQGSILLKKLWCFCFLFVFFLVSSSNSPIL
jgi:hypothetical protein